jgi:tetratricopeptide (TPR) repeat protein
MDTSERKTQVPAKSEREILLDISSGLVTRETAAAMWDHLVPGELVDAVGVPLEESEASDIRTEFMDAVEQLAEIEVPHARLVLMQLFVPSLAERASVPYEFLVSKAREEGSDGRDEVDRLLLRKARLFNPAHPPTAIAAYRRLIELRPGDGLARGKLERYERGSDDQARYELGRLLHRTGDLSGAEQAYRDLLALPAVAPFRRATTLKGLAATVGALGRPEEAHELRGQAALETEAWMNARAARIDEKAERARSAGVADMERLERAADEAMERGDYHAADASLLELLGLQQQGNEVAAAHTVWRLADTALAVGELDEAADRFRVAAQAYKAMGHDAPLAGILREHGRMEMGRGRLDEAEALFRRALKLETSRSDADSAVVTMGALASLERTRGRTDRAVRWLRKALDLAVKSGNPGKEGWVLGLLATAARKRQDGLYARRWTEWAIKAYERAGNQEMVGRELGTLGRLHFEEGELDAASSPLERARAIFEELGDREALGQTLSILGSIELRRKRFESAERYLRLASAIHQERFDNEAGAVTLSALGDLAHRRGDVDAARDAWQKALARYSNIDMWESDDAKRIRAMLDRNR